MKTLAKILGGILLLVIIIVGYIAATQFSTSLSYQELSDYAYETATLPDGFKMNYRNAGNLEGHPLLLVHGGGASLNDWDPWLEPLSQYKLILVDMPNHGLSDPLPGNQVNTVEFSKKIESFVDTIGLQDFAIAGHSFGGETVLHYVTRNQVTRNQVTRNQVTRNQVTRNQVTRNPANIKGLILIGSGGYQPDIPEDSSEKDLAELAESPLSMTLLSYYGTREGVAETVPEYFYDQSVITDAFIDRIYSLMRYEKNRGSMISMIANAAKDYKVVKGVTDIHIPTLILWGDKDSTAVPEHGYRFDQDIPDSTLKMYPEVGHMVMHEATEQSTRDVIEFLEARIFTEGPASNRQ